MSKKQRRGDGTGSVTPYQTAAGTRYRITWREPVNPDQPESRRRQRSRGGFHNEKDANTELLKTLVRINAGATTPEGNDTLGSAARIGDI